MAVLDLATAVLSLADDPTQQIAAFSTGWSEVPVSTVQVRTMASGRRRSVRRKGEGVTLGWTMPLLTRQQTETVKAWAGRTVLIRDVQGRKVYGVYAIGAVGDYKDRQAHSVSFTLQSVTFPDLAP